MSIGGIQSNHTRQVTGVARYLGLGCVTVQEGWVDWPDPNYDKVGNIQLTRIMGGDIRIDPAGFDIGIRDSWKQALESVIEAGGRPYAIPAGASDHPLGGLGFANWAREVAAQERDLDIFFDTIIVCTVTGSSHAGMIAGFALEDRDDRRVIGIDASATLDQTIAQVTRIATNTAQAIGLGRLLRDDEITVVPGYEGPAYGIPDQQTVDAIHLAARTEGMLTDPVYEGKSMAGLIGMIRSGEIAPDRRCCTATSAANRCCRPTSAPSATSDTGAESRAPNPGREATVGGDGGLGTDAANWGVRGRRPTCRPRGDGVDECHQYAGWFRAGRSYGHDIRRTSLEAGQGGTLDGQAVESRWGRSRVRAAARSADVFCRNDITMSAVNVTKPSSVSAAFPGARRSLSTKATAHMPTVATVTNDAPASPPLQDASIDDRR